VITSGERNRRFDDPLVEVSSPVVVRGRRGVFVRSRLGGGQAGVYYWIDLQTREAPRLDVSESP
jgi:hypothetical protein